jgi:hypothetical protein
MKLSSILIHILVVVVILSTCNTASAWQRHYQLRYDYVMPIGTFTDVAQEGSGLTFSSMGIITENTYMTGSISLIGFEETRIENGLNHFEYDSRYYEARKVQWIAFPLTVGFSHHLSGIGKSGLFIRSKGGAIIRDGIFDGNSSLDDGGWGDETGYLFSSALGFELGKLSVISEYSH